MRRGNRWWCLLGLFGAFHGCTFVTDSNDRKVVDKLDFELVMSGMSAHQTKQVDVALVHPADPKAAAPGPNDPDSKTIKYEIRGRARVLLPPISTVPGAVYPDVDIKLRGIVADEPLQVLFYADTNNNFSPDLIVPSGDREHSWTRVVPASGKVVFPHNIMFQNFFDDEIMPIAHDIILDVPAASVTPAHAACLNAQLTQVMKSSLEVRIFFNPEKLSDQSCAFKMYAGNVLPTEPIKCKGISDTNSDYGVEALIDDRVIHASLSARADVNGLTIPFEQWLPLDPMTIAACLAM